MRKCLLSCLRDLLGWVLGGSVISGIAAYLFGITLVVGTTVIVTFPPGVIAALIAIATVAILGFLVSISFCYVLCKVPHEIRTLRSNWFSITKLRGMTP